MKIFNGKSQINAEDTMYPCYAWLTKSFGTGCSTSTFYGYCFGPTTLTIPHRSFKLENGDFFSVPGRPDIDAADWVFIVEKYGYRGQVVIGKTEEKGRLSYIDGCSDSMLVYPPRKGDPSLNLLYFPPNVVQKEHTHPSVRLGVVISGSGVAYPGKIDDNEYGSELKPGYMFCIEENEKHYFVTTSTGMRIVAFHPEGDWGPTDENHGMINRTYLNGRR